MMVMNCLRLEPVFASNERPSQYLVSLCLIPWNYIVFCNSLNLKL